MKLRYIIASLALAAGVFTACNTAYELSGGLDAVQLSSTYISISENGGSSSISLTAKDSWQIDTTGAEAEWLDISPMSGTAGESTVTFSAEAVDYGRVADLKLYCAGAVQHFKVSQGSGSAVKIATVAEVLAGADNKSYQVTATVTRVSSAYYGNMYVNDGTSEDDLYIYGLVDSGGNYPKEGANWDMVNVGDEVTISGPRTTYNGVIELVDALLMEIIKSLISVDGIVYLNSDVEAIPMDGGSALVSLACSGDDINVTFEDDCDWLSVDYSYLGSGICTVALTAVANDGGDRSTTVTFTTTSGGVTYTAEAAIAQKGAIIDATIAEFNEAEVGDTYYRLSGIVTSIASYKYGNCYIQDYTGSTYVYGLMDAAGNNPASGDNWELGVGYMLTLTGQRGVYGSTIEVLNPVYEKLTPVTEVTIAEFLEMEDADDVFYMVTGTISSIYNDKYGNLYLTDDSTDETLYVYGCYGYGASDSSDKQYFLSNNGIEEGDTITLVGYKTTYNGVIEMMNGYYVTHTSAGE